MSQTGSERFTQKIIETYGWRITESYLSMQMKILHIITSLRIGGAERMVSELLPRLCNRGHDVKLLLFDGTRSSLYDHIEQEGIMIHTLGKGNMQMWNPLHVFRLRKFLHRKRFDIVHTHNTPCQLLTALAAGKNAPMLVTTEHNTFNRRRNWRWYSAIDRWMYGRYDYVICVGEKVKENLTTKLYKNVNSPNIAVVPNGIDLKRFTNTVLYSSKKKDEYIIIMVAAFRKQKDQPTLLRAMLYLPDNYTLWLAGDGEQKKECEKLANTLEINHRVRFLGDRTDVPQLLVTADVVVLSSHYEGFGLAIVEGMATGRPIIASDVDGLHDIVAGVGLLFPHKDHKRLAGLIRQVCENKEYGLEVAARCQKKAMQYDIENTVYGYEQIYDKLIQKETMKKTNISRFVTKF